MNLIMAGAVAPAGAVAQGAVANQRFIFSEIARAGDTTIHSVCPDSLLETSAVHRVDVVPNGTIQRLIDRAESEAPKPSDGLAALVKFWDSYLLAFWASEAGEDSSIRIVTSHDRRLGLSRALCHFRSRQFVRSYAISHETAVDSIPTSIALRMMLGARTHVTNGRVDILSDAQLNAEQIGLPNDSLRAVESLLGWHVNFGVLFLLSKDSASFAESVPFAWRDRNQSDWSLTVPGLGAVVFVARRPKSWSIHELVHVVISSAHLASIDGGRAFPYLAEEALARAVGGSNGRSFGALVGEHSFSDAVAILDSSNFGGGVSLTAPVPGFALTRQIDVLAAIYRVALRSCRKFPARLLAIRPTDTPSEVVEKLAQSVGHSIAEAKSLVAIELSQRSVDPLTSEAHKVTDRERCN